MKRHNSEQLRCPIQGCMADSFLKRICIHIYIYIMSPTRQYIWGDSLGSAAAAVVLVVFPDLRLCPDSRVRVAIVAVCAGCVPGPC